MSKSEHHPDAVSAAIAGRSAMRQIRRAGQNSAWVATRPAKVSVYCSPVL